MFNTMHISNYSQLNENNVKNIANNKSRSAHCFSLIFKVTSFQK